MCQFWVRTQSKKKVGQKNKTKKHKLTYSTWLAARRPQLPEVVLMHISSINWFPRTLQTFANYSAMDSQRHTAVMRLRSARGCPCLELVVVVPLLRSVPIADAALLVVALYVCVAKLQDLAPVTTAHHVTPCALTSCLLPTSSERAQYFSVDTLEERVGFPRHSFCHGKVFYKVVVTADWEDILFQIAWFLVRIKATPLVGMWRRFDQDGKRNQRPEQRIQLDNRQKCTWLTP